MMGMMVEHEMIVQMVSGHLDLEHMEDSVSGVDSVLPSSSAPHVSEATLHPPFVLTSCTLTGLDFRGRKVQSAMPIGRVEGGWFGGSSELWSLL